ncbi:hypothetical protein FQZ97_808060 [compost metagenome]
MVAHVGLVQAFETGFVFGPGELAAVHDGAADGGAVAAQVFGERVHHDVGTVFERAAQVGAGDRVVHDQRHAGGVRHGGERADVGHVAQRVAHRFAVDRLGALVDQRGERGRIARIGETHRDALLREGVGKQVVGAAVERGGRDDVVARFGDGLDRRRDGRHARGHGECTHAAFQCGQARFEHAVGGVHDAAVDVAGDLEVEQIGAVLRVVERVGHGLVDRHRHRLGGGVGGVAAVHGDGLDFHAVSGRLLLGGRGIILSAARPRSHRGDAHPGR